MSQAGQQPVVVSELVVVDHCTSVDGNVAALYVWSCVWAQVEKDARSDTETEAEENETDSELSAPNGLGAGDHLTAAHLAAAGRSN